MSKHKGEHHDEGIGGHGDRPWVYFMIDCFLLMNNFFIMSFKFKVEEPILPQKMPPGNTAVSRASSADRNKEKLVVHCTRTGDKVTYEYQSRQVGLPELSRTLAGVAGSGKDVTVRVSYGDDCQWQDIISVFDECQRLKIAECGLIPSRTERAGRM